MGINTMIFIKIIAGSIIDLSIAVSRRHTRINASNHDHFFQIRGVGHEIAFIFQGFIQLRL